MNPILLAEDESKRVTLNRAPKTLSMEKAALDLIKGIGEDPNREGLVRTPKRFAKALQDLTKGYTESVEKLVNDALFQVDYSEMVLVKNIEVYSLCEHHMLPFFGKCHVAYIPQGKIIGLSKIPRIVDVFARRLQVQERLTNEISQCLQEVLNPMGVGVMMEATHMCMLMRGVEKQCSTTTTSSLTGVFKDPTTRAEFLALTKSI